MQKEDIETVAFEQIGSGSGTWAAAGGLVTPTYRRNEPCNCFTDQEIAIAVRRLKGPSATCEPEPKTSVSERVHTNTSVSDDDIKLETNELLEQCTTCAKGFNSKNNLLVQVRSMHLLHNSQCQHCGKGFKNQKALHNHIKGHLHKLWKVCQ